ncbi:MAG TPA: protein kinase [Steroidobacteraceae bacterium]|jgi:serine/threonine-protein kinase|nr:protein kinase [Steroidobacteraceae bacterium]
MPAPGSRLGRFEILELLGAGGMGEVYRARDLRLGREVALKLLPDQFVRDPQRLARFERETQVLASLNHPNIAALHEIVAIEGSHALVLELVEGETLSERISRGAFPVPEALGIAAQIATALDAAHERGIVHRDLKPGNVKLRPDGTVKLLDFGIAKVLDPITTVSNPAAVTLTAAEAPGGGARILGSPAYMSPEQARGMAVDKRGDIWSFGCVLYEMLSGVRAFGGEAPSDVIAKVIEREPDFAALPAELPFTVRRLLQRCLEKDRRRRLRDIGDARLELLDALDNPGREPTATGPFAARAASRNPWVRRRVLGAFAIAVALAIAAAWLAQRGNVPVPVVTRFAITDGSFAEGGLAISADGTRIAYLNDLGLVVRSRDQLESKVVAPLNVVQGNPFFSPDGEWVGFRGWEALRTVPANGGPVTMVADRHTAAVGAWVGKDIFFAGMTGIFRTSAHGDVPVALAAPAEGEQIVTVQVLPNRRAILFTVIPTRGNVYGMAASLPSARIEALDLVTGRRQVVVRGGGRPHYTSTGHLLYVSGGTLYAVPFDVSALRTRGAAVPVIVSEGLLEYDVSAEGTLIYQAALTKGLRALAWVDRRGRATSLGAPGMGYAYPRVSPDGTRVAIDVMDSADRDIWMWDIGRRTLERFTKDPTGNPIVTWSPDGSHLVFGSERSGVSNAYRQASDGSGEPERLLASDALQMPISYTPDGRLLVSVDVKGQQRDIYLMTLDGEHKIEPLIHGPANELWAEVSPDGRWLVYDSDESGQFEVYVRPFPDAYRGSRWQISAAGGRQPVWSRDGRELFYRDFSGALMSVPVPAGPGFTPGRPVRLFDGTGYTGSGPQGGGRTYDVSPDGSRFLMVRVGDQSNTPLVVVLNWFEELKRLAPIR